MRIERWLTIVALVSAGSVAAGSDREQATPGSSPDSTDVRVVRTTEHHPEEAMRRVCRSDRDVKGCTDFPIEFLTCRCERRGNGWVIRARAELHAVSHYRRASQHARLMIHEELHLIDLTEGLKAHLKMLASSVYDSEAACRKRAWELSGSSYLKGVMNRLRVESNVKFGCMRMVRVPGPDLRGPEEAVVSHRVAGTAGQSSSGRSGTVR